MLLGGRGKHPSILQYMGGLAHEFLSTGADNTRETLTIPPKAFTTQNEKEDKMRNVCHERHCKLAQGLEKELL